MQIGCKIITWKSHAWTTHELCKHLQWDAEHSFTSHLHKIFISRFYMEISNEILCHLHSHSHWAHSHFRSSIARRSARSHPLDSCDVLMLARMLCGPCHGIPFEHASCSGWECQPNGTANRKYAELFALIQPPNTINLASRILLGNTVNWALLSEYGSSRIKYKPNARR